MAVNMSDPPIATVHVVRIQQNILRLTLGLKSKQFFFIPILK
jgi:hypothetical protein